MNARYALVAAMLCGCLETPRPRQADSSVPDASPDGPPDGTLDGPSDASFDAPPDASPDARVFPPTDFTINIVAGSVADMNGDMVDDIVVASAFDDSQPGDGHGVFVLLGKPAGIGKTYEAFLTTRGSPLAPMPVAVAGGDLVGSAEADVIALARLPATTSDPARGFLVLFEGTGDLSFRPAVLKETNDRGDNAPSLNRPRHLAASQFDNDSNSDIVFGTAGHLYTAEIPRSSERGFEQMLPEILRRTEASYWSMARDVLLVGPSGTKDVVVIDSNVYWFRNGGSWSFSNVTPEVLDPSVTYTFADASNVFGDEAPEIVGGWLRAISGTTLASAPKVEHSLTDLPTASDSNFDDLLVAELGLPGSGKDLILLDNYLSASPESGQGNVFVLEDVYVAADDFLRAPFSPLRYTLPAGFTVSVFVTGDFDGDKRTEVFLMDTGGRTLCLRAVPRVKLSRCEEE